MRTKTASRGTSENNRSGRVHESAGEPRLESARSTPSTESRAGHGGLGNLATQYLTGPSSDAPPTPGPATHAALGARSGGAALPSPLRTTMGSALGADLSGVRIHTDAAAAQATQELNAHAFTSGRDIYFGAGRYQPETNRGRHLLAHELTHTLQQAPGVSSETPGNVSSYRLGHSHDPLEREADTVARGVAAGRPGVQRVSPAGANLLQRQVATADSPATTPSHTGASSGGSGPGGSSFQPAAGGTFGGGGASGSLGPPLPAPVATPVPASRRPASAPSSTTEITFPAIKLFDAAEKTLPLLTLPILSTPIWVAPVTLPPPLFFATVGIYARVGFDLELFLRYGPAMLRDIRLALDPSGHRYSGTAQFYMSVAMGPRATLAGSLTGAVHWLGLFEALALEGGLQAIGQAPLIVALDPTVNVIYDSGSYTFSLSPQIDAGVALIFDFIAYARARLAGKEIWKKQWNLYHWHWGKALRLGTKLSLDYTHGSLGPVRHEPYAERISIDELLQGMKKPADQGSFAVVPPGPRPAKDRLQELLAQSGSNPQLILSALAEADAGEKAAISADPAMKGAIQGAVGNALWPTAERILAGAPSVTVPSLDEGTVYLADRHIRLGRFQDALHAVVSRLQTRGTIDGSLCDFTYTRDTSRGEGATRLPTYTVDPATHKHVASGRSQVQIFDPAFVNVPWLYSTIMHEYVHVLQTQSAIAPSDFSDPDRNNIWEVEAYLWEIEHARGSGVIVSRQQMNELGKRLTDHFTTLSKPNRAKYQVRVDAAMRLVRAAASGVLPVNITFSIADARRTVQQSSRQIAELVRKREAAAGHPADIAKIDAEIAKIQRARSDALVELVLAENPNVQIVDRAKGIYRVPITDGAGRVQWVFGSISVVWHLQRLSPSVFTLGADIRANPPPTLPPGTTVSTHLLVGGSGIQSTVQPFPGDIDFAEEFNIAAPDAHSAGIAAADTIAGFVGRSSSSREIEFLVLRVRPPAPVSGKVYDWPAARILDPAQRAELADQLATTTDGRINTFWRALVDGNRFVEVTKVLTIHAVSTITHKDLIATQATGAEFQEAYLDEAPAQIEPIELGAYAALMRTQAREFAFGKKQDFLKAAKRAFNYFRTIGNIEAMELITPVFATDQARINQQAAVLEAIASSLDPATPSRLLTADFAQLRLREAAALIRTSLPVIPGKRLPAAVATELESIATALTGVGGSPTAPLAPDATQQARLAKLLKDDVKATLSLSLEAQVKPIIDKYVPK